MRALLLFSSVSVVVKDGYDDVKQEAYGEKQEQGAEEKVISHCYVVLIGR